VKPASACTRLDRTGCHAAALSLTKNQDPVSIPLNTAALAALSVQRERTGLSGYVFEHRDTGFHHVNGAQAWFRKALAKAEISDFTWHDLRHHFARSLRQRGAQLTDIAELLGHRGLMMTKRYAHQSMVNLATVVNTLDVKKQLTPQPIPHLKALPRRKHRNRRNSL
jgi:integrase